MQIIKTNRLVKTEQIHLSYDDQLTTVGFDSPLQQVLQQQMLLLRLLDQQNRWQLWLSSRPMLKREWIQHSGLSESKVIQLPYIAEDKIIDVIEKALLSGTSSYIVACVNHLTEADKLRLQMATKAGGSHLFLVNENYMNYNDFMTMSQQVSHQRH